MGASMVYLQEPNTDIQFHAGESKKYKTRYVAAEMQGWRLNMVSYACFPPYRFDFRKTRTSPILSSRTTKLSSQSLTATVAKKWLTTQKSITPKSFLRSLSLRRVTLRKRCGSLS